MPRPLSAPLPIEDLQHLEEAIQGATALASRLCLEATSEEEKAEKLINHADLTLLFSKVESISSSWSDLMRASRAIKKFNMNDVSNETCRFG